MAIVGLLFSVPRADNVPRLITTVLVGVLIGSAVFLIQSFDRPYSGLLAVRPVQMLETARQITDDYTESYTDPRPCDLQGRPSPALP